jgi:hypothetical protein
LRSFDFSFSFGIDQRGVVRRKARRDPSLIEGLFATSKNLGAEEFVEDWFGFMAWHHFSANHSPLPLSALPVLVPQRAIRMTAKKAQVFAWMLIARSG